MIIMQSEAPVMPLATAVLKAAASADLTIALAESCTGGLISAVLTEVEGYSHVFERGFVVYTDDAKREMLAVDDDVLKRCGAVSAPCAQQMASGALLRSRADVAVSVTGYADPASAQADAGLVFVGLALKGQPAQHRSARFQETSRARVRLDSLRLALETLRDGILMAAQTKGLAGRTAA